MKVWCSFYSYVVNTDRSTLKNSSLGMHCINQLQFYSDVYEKKMDLSSNGNKYFKQ